MADITNLNADWLNTPLCRVTTYPEKQEEGITIHKKDDMFYFPHNYTKKSTNNQKVMLTEF